VSEETTNTRVCVQRLLKMSRILRRLFIGHRIPESLVQIHLNEIQSMMYIISVTSIAAIIKMYIFNSRRICIMIYNSVQHTGIDQSSGVDVIIYIYIYI
jgi:hypothetical protein